MVHIALVQYMKFLVDFINLVSRRKNESLEDFRKRKNDYEKERYKNLTPERKIKKEIRQRKWHHIYYKDNKQKILYQNKENPAFGKIPWNKNLTFKDPRILYGERNPAWLGGKSFEHYGLEFNDELKEFIRNRDNHICQLCLINEISTGRKLYIHHIDYNKKNNNETNLISLCLYCHAKTRVNREYWTKLFISKIEAKYIEKNLSCIGNTSRNY